MALKTPHVFLIILWLSLFLLLFHELHTTNSSLSRHPPIIRKSLATKFDFTPFLKHHRHNHHNRKNLPDVHGPPEIDPRYGVDKRLVPTGPNPLHH
ncbi:CLE13p like [Actinidia chinensis var. chinensis]|uniref:CLE13p like n=1 Tax=Actinidia chinensis var. chinensis TaxID=1590841 RepID=A0A2R6PB43_ACTCC|nr:CLE13p like [Actinidia chinensis var. chinensis]